VLDISSDRPQAPPSLQLGRLDQWRAAQGRTPLPPRQIRWCRRAPADFGKLIVAETEKWGKVIRLANIKPEW